LWAISFLIGKRATELSENPNYWIAGVCLGLAFLFRYQIGIIILFIGLWLLIQRVKWVNIMKISTGLIVIIVLGIGLDSWFYGDFVLAPYNYFDFNISKGGSEEFGVEPWYFYIQEITLKSIAPLGVVSIMALLFYIVKKPLSLITWLVVPFVVVHLLIPHKELRFLYPLAAFLPLILCYFIEFLNERLKKPVMKITAQMILLLLFMINITGMIAVMITPPHDGHVAICKYISENYSDKDLCVIASHFSNPYSPTGGCQMDFYRPENLDGKFLDGMELDKFHKGMLWSDRHNFLVLRRMHVNKWGEDYINDLGFVRVKTALPIWFVDRLQDWYKKDEIWYLYLYEGTY
jgi:phosphatidylinositol glycan class B